MIKNVTKEQHSGNFNGLSVQDNPEKDHLKKAAAGRLPAGDQKTWGW